MTWFFKLVQRWGRYVVLILFLVAALVFPFSVAATNIALGTVLGLGILSGLWWKGAGQMWQRHRWLCITALFYWGLMVLGLAWSSDRIWGLHVLGRQWYWLLVPLVVQLFGDNAWRNRLFGALSLGLTAHLLFCVLQMFGYVTGTTAGGSNIHDATGHIGHIGFGVVYGMWMGFLLQWGHRQAGWQRVAAWLLAGWALGMVFAAQGRSGYLVTLVVLVILLWQYIIVARSWRFAVPAISLLLFAGILMVGLGSAKHRLLETEYSTEVAMRGDIHHAETRWSLWLAAWYVWRAHPVVGIGTGGFPKASVWAKKNHPELDYDGRSMAAHPHNMYLLALARWGLPGLSALMALFFVWMRTGWSLGWSDSDAGALIALSGIALAVHGLSAPSLEEHFEDILAVMFLGSGLAILRKTHVLGDLI